MCWGVVPASHFTLDYSSTPSFPKNSIKCNLHVRKHTITQKLGVLNLKVFKTTDNF